jgi:hypothetical protein
MSKLSFNEFLKKHQTRICIFFHFPDYQALKKAAAKRKGGIPPLADGRIIPPPGSVVAALIKKLPNGDYATKSHSGGVVQQVMLSDQAVVDQPAKALHLKFERSSSPPCTVQTACVIEMAAHLRIAETNGLL